MLGFDKKLTGLFGKITKLCGARYFVHKLSACYLAFLHNSVSAYIFLIGEILYAKRKIWLKNPPNSQNFSLVYPPFPCYNKLVFANTPFYINKEMYPLWQQRKAA